MQYNEVKENLCKAKLRNKGVVICIINPQTYKTICKTEYIDIFTNFTRFKMYDEYVVIFTKNNSYTYGFCEIICIAYYDVWKGIRENADPKHLNTNVPINYVCTLEQERIDQQQAYNDYQFQNFLNQTKCIS